MVKQKKSGFQGRKQWRAIERILSLLPEHAAAGLREQMRRERASREGKTQQVTAREEALTRYLAWIGEPDRTIIQILDDFKSKDQLRDDPIGRELREALELALKRSIAKTPGRIHRLNDRSLRRYFENGQRGVWKRR